LPDFTAAAKVRIRSSRLFREVADSKATSRRLFRVAREYDWDITVARPNSRGGCPHLSNAKIPAMLKNQSPKARAKKIKLLLFDVDGVLTDGEL
jgi:hypothetical protein